MSKIQVLGIDLGTANSIVAGVNQLGHSVVMRDREGQLSTPSVVLFDDERTVVGEEARLRGKHKPQQMAASLKREMGRELYSQPIGRMRLPPEVIQACILNKLRIEMAAHVAPNVGVVIGVPANFNDAQRRATAEAGEMAGFRVLDVLNEPIAAALAFAEHVPLNLNKDGKPSYLLVYDLGGYTFEATLLELTGGHYMTLGTQRDEHLGGHDWDMRLVDHIAEQFQKTHGVDPRTNYASLAHLIQLAAKAKIALSLRPSTVFHVEHEGHSLEIGLTRERFGEMTQDILNRTIELAEKLLADAELTWLHLSRVLLVGGATRMPSIRKLLKHKTYMEPDSTVNPEEAVARGCALYAAFVHHGATIQTGQAPLKISNVNTHSLGIEGVDASGKRTNRILIKRGTPLPARVKCDFLVKPSKEKSITLTVLEGESTDPEKCKVIGRAVLRELPVEMDQDWPVEVTYVYDSNGRISVDARLRYTEKAVHLEMTRVGGLSTTHRERWKQVVMAAGGMASYRQVLLRNYQDDTPGPIALADSNPPTHAEAEPSTENAVMSFLKRIVPFAFRGAATGSVEDASSASETATKKDAPIGGVPLVSKAESPPTLELLD